MNAPRTLAAMAALTVTSAGAAGAVTFDFTGTTDTASVTHSVTSEGVTVTASGVACYRPGCVGADLDRWGNGLDIHSAADTDHRVDGSGALEAVVLTFSQAVSLTGLRFHHVDRRDDFALWGSDGAGWTKLLRAAVTDDDPKRNTTGGHDFAAPFTGSVFAVAATDAADGWKLRGVSADVPPSQPPAPVPLPAGVALLLGGLGALDLLRRRAA